MIFVLERPAGELPRAWFAFDAEDLLRKVAALDITQLREAHDRLGDVEPADLAAAALRARSDCRLYWNEAEATGAFECADDAAWQGEGWRARWALREQLVAMDVLADDL